MYHFVIKAVLVISLSSFSLIAQAQTKPIDPYSVPQPTAVENKTYVPAREINMQLGFLPLDAFYKAIVINAAYTHYFQSYWGWEVANVTGAFSIETGLRNDLRTQFSAQSSSFLDYIRHAMTTNIVYTPIYSKNLWFNKKVIHGEISGLAGGGFVAFESGDTAPMFGGGMIFRFFSSDRWSYKLDNRLYYHLGDGKSTNFYLSVALGIAYEFAAKE